MKLIAHRGVVTKDIKENTLAAFIKAIYDENYVGFELDVRQTKDKKFVIHHNLLHNDKFISNYDYNEIKTDIPLLLDVLKLDTNKIILIEIKDYKINYQSFIKVLNKYSNKDIYVMSFHGNVIKELKKLNCPFKLGILNYLINTEVNYNYDFICYINDFINDKIISYCHKHNIELFSYAIYHKKQIVNKNIYYIVDDETII
ncbi:MAG: glycerophosphodiester phosphodiesterase [Bacilli bacterium]|nr:glycerophosphodiester phosphodiesterase [Bacilli bacterium]